MGAVFFHRLGRPQLAQQLTTAELDEVSIVRGERLACHPSVNGFAGADEIRGLLTNIKHGGTPYEPEGQGVKEGVQSLTVSHRERYPACVVRIFFYEGRAERWRDG